MNREPYHCHHCGTPGLQLAETFKHLQRVTSDATAAGPGGELALCAQCGTVQSPPTAQWQRDCNHIYSHYNIYHQSNGTEQQIFAQAQAPQGRSVKLAALLQQHVQMPTSGRLLDIGCANGCFLRAWAATAPQWELAGMEFDRRHEENLVRIPGFATLYTGHVAQIEKQFDLITFVHVLEHIPQPHGILQAAAAKLTPGGYIAIQVPDCSNNAPIIGVADHSTHYGANSLHNTGTRAGLETVLLEPLLPKELTFVLRKGKAPQFKDARAEGNRIFQQAQDLYPTAQRLRRLVAANPGNWGIFGTSIAATWLAQEIPDATGFFVDEDPTRQGRCHMGKPIVSPLAVPPGSHIIVAMPGQQGQAIAQRLATKTTHYHPL
jgi:SAM-dependent methyltransferase